MELEKIKQKSNNISDLVDEIQMNDLFNSEFQNPLVIKLLKKCKKLNRKLQKL